MTATTYILLALAAAVLLCPTSATAQSTSGIAFTGDAHADFVGLVGTQVHNNWVADVGLPEGIETTGWNITDVYFSYNSAADELSVGIRCLGVCGDADGDGDQANTSEALAAFGGVDEPNLKNTEAIVMLIGAATGEFAPTLAIGADINMNSASFGARAFDPTHVQIPAIMGMSSEPLPWDIGALVIDSGDIEFVIPAFSTLYPSLDFSFRVYAGSFTDGGIGEAFVPSAWDELAVVIDMANAKSITSTGGESYVAIRSEPIGYTGDAAADFVGVTGVQVSGNKDWGVGLPGDSDITSTGWNITDVYFSYDAATDALQVGVNCYGVCGDADGDGDQANTSEALAALGGTDRANFGGTEFITLAFAGADMSGNNTDFVVGVAGDGTMTSAEFGAYTTDEDLPILGFGAPVTGWAVADVEIDSEDIEFTIPGFSTLFPELTFAFHAYQGSLEDDGIGEMYVPEQAVYIDMTATRIITPSYTNNHDVVDELAPCDGNRDANGHCYDDDLYEPNKVLFVRDAYVVSDDAWAGASSASGTSNVAQINRVDKAMLLDFDVVCGGEHVHKALLSVHVVKVSAAASLSFRLEALTTGFDAATITAANAPMPGDAFLEFTPRVGDNKIDVGAYVEQTCAGRQGETTTVAFAIAGHRGWGRVYTSRKEAGAYAPTLDVAFYNYDM